MKLLKNQIFTKILCILVIFSQITLFSIELPDMVRNKSLKTNNLAPPSLFAQETVTASDKSPLSFFHAPQIKKVIISVLVLIFLALPATNLLAKNSNTVKSIITTELSAPDNLQADQLSNSVLNTNDEVPNPLYSTEVDFNENFATFLDKISSNSPQLTADYYLKKLKYDRFRYDRPFKSDDANQRVKEYDAFLSNYFNSLDLKTASLDNFMTSKVKLIETKGADEKLIKMLIIDLLVLKTLQPDVYEALDKKNTSILYTALDMHGNAYGDTFMSRIADNRSFMTIASASISTENWLFRQTTMAHEGQHIKDLPTNYFSMFFGIHPGILDIFRSLPRVEQPAFLKGDNLILKTIKIDADSSFYLKERNSYMPIKMIYFGEAAILISFEMLGILALLKLVKQRKVKRKNNPTQRQKTKKQSPKKIVARSRQTNYNRQIKKRTQSNTLSSLIKGLLSKLTRPKQNRYNKYKRDKNNFSLLKVLLAVPVSLIVLLSEIISKSLKNLSPPKKHNRFHDKIRMHWYFENQKERPLMSFSLNKNIKDYNSFLHSLDNYADVILDSITKRIKHDRIFKRKLDKKYNGDNYYLILSDIQISINVLTQKYGNNLPNYQRLSNLQQIYANRMNHEYVPGMLSLSFILEILNTKYTPVGNAKHSYFIKTLQIAA